MRVTRVRISLPWQRNRISEPSLIFWRLESLTRISVVLLPAAIQAAPMNPASPNTQSRFRLGTSDKSMDMLPASNGAAIENRTFDVITVGDNASIVRTFTEADIELFAVVSGDVNPSHLDLIYAKTDLFHRVVAHGM